MTGTIARRCLDAGAMLAALLVLTPGIAEAHGGPVVYSGRAGPYELEAYRLFGYSEEQRILTYSLYLTSESSGERVEGATLVATPHRGGLRLAAAQMSSLGNHYEAQFRVEGDSGWSIDLSVDGPLGRASITHVLQPPATVAETIAPYALPLLVAALILTGRARRRGEESRSPLSRRYAPVAQCKGPSHLKRRRRLQQ